MYRYIFALLALLLQYFPFVAQSSFVIKDVEVSRLIGYWEGELTYLDYQTNQPYTMPANLRITRLGGTEDFAFEKIYPGEPQANSIDTVSLKGSTFMEGLLISRKTVDQDVVVLTTSSTGTDGNDNRAANFRHTYTIGKAIFQIKKEVQFVGTSSWILRHEYRYKRTNPKPLKR